MLNQHHYFPMAFSDQFFLSHLLLTVGCFDLLRMSYLMVVSNHHLMIFAFVHHPQVCHLLTTHFQLNPVKIIGHLLWWQLIRLFHLALLSLKYDHHPIHSKQNHQMNLATQHSLSSYSHFYPHFLLLQLLFTSMTFWCCHFLSFSFESFPYHNQHHQSPKWLIVSSSWDRYSYYYFQVSMFSQTEPYLLHP